MRRISRPKFGLNAQGPRDPCAARRGRREDDEEGSRGVTKYMGEAG